MDEADRYRALADERGAVIERIKAYVGLGLQDARMKIWSKILLEKIHEIEKDEAAKRR